MKTFNDQYLDALEMIMLQESTVSPRGLPVKEILFHQFRIDPDDNRISLPGFHTNRTYAQEELRWYLNGGNRIDFSPLIQKTWERYSDDGIHVNSAYGYYLFGKHLQMDDGSGDIKSQWDWVIEKLQADPDSRQAVMNINLPSHKLKPTKDLPCTMNVQVLLRNHRLYWLTTMRSQDIYLGTRNDVYCFTELQKRMAQQLKTGLGEYVHACASLHLYEPQWKVASDLLFHRRSS